MAPVAAALPIISAVAGIGGTALSVYGALQQADAQRAQAEYSEDMAKYNAKVAEGNAQMAEDEGKEIKRQAYEDSLKKRQEAAQIVGTQRARQSAAGAQVDVGSALDLNLDTVEKGELDAFAIKEQGAWADYNKRVEAQNHRNQGEIQMAKSKIASNEAKRVSPFLTTAPTLLSGIKTASSSFGRLL